MISAVASALPAAAVAAPSIGELHPDADHLLLELDRRFEALVPDAEVALNIVNDLVDEFESRRPARGTELTIRPSDRDFYAWCNFAGDPLASGMHFSVRQVNIIRVAFASVTPRPDSLPECRIKDRADNIVRAFEAWTADCGELREALGLDIAEQRQERFEEDIDALILAALALPASSAAGLAVKARMAAWCCGGAVDPGEDSAFDQRLLWSIARDALDLRVAS